MRLKRHRLRSAQIRDIFPEGKGVSGAMNGNWGLVTVE
jgi:hypothetical protein